MRMPQIQKTIQKMLKWWRKDSDMDSRDLTAQCEKADKGVREGYMRILVISDTHGKHDNLDKVLEQERPYDYIIHLGDAEGAEDYIEAVGECPLSIVRGNNDFFSELPEEEILELEGFRILITHGHYYYVAAGNRHLIREAHGRDVGIVMYGHTHVPEITKDGELYVVNPGSLSYPRQENHRPSYVVMNLAQDQEPEFILKYL